MLRNILAFVLGMVAGMAANMAIITLNSSVLFPMPEGIDQRDPEQMNSYLATLPAVAFVVVMIAHLAQSFIGGFVAAKVAGSKPMFMAMVVGTFSLAGGVAAMQMFEGPSWMAVELPLYLVTAWLGCKLARPTQSQTA